MQLGMHAVNQHAPGGITVMRDRARIEDPLGALPGHSRPPRGARAHENAMPVEGVP